jgi:hypothetical protein
VHRLPREVLRHHTSTKFRLGVIRRVHELFKRPSFFDRRGNAAYSGRVVLDLEYWDRGFESRSRHGCMSAFVSFSSLQPNILRSSYYNYFSDHVIS